MSDYRGFAVCILCGGTHVKLMWLQSGEHNHIFNQSPQADTLGDYYCIANLYHGIALRVQ